MYYNNRCNVASVVPDHKSSLPKDGSSLVHEGIGGGSHSGAFRSIFNKSFAGRGVDWSLGW